MKRVLSLFLSCIFVLGVCFSTPIIASAAEPETFEAGGSVFQYEEGSKECSVEKWGDTEVKSLTVSGPVKYNGEDYTITGILSGAFSGCEKLESITIKSNIETIEAGAFVGCTALTAFIESSESQNAKFEVVDGVLFNADKTTLIAYPAGKTGETYTIPATVTEIADGAFSGCKSLETITVAEGNTAFSVTEDGILFNANKTKLVAYPSGKIAETYTIPTTVTEIADGAFSGCKSLKTITVAAENTVFSATEDGVLFSQEGTKLIAYPAGKTGETYTIPATVTGIATGAFIGCDNLKYIFMEQTTGEDGNIIIGGLNDIFTQPGVCHEGMIGHNFSGEEGSKKCTVCCLLKDGNDKQHTWENGKCEVCGFCKHTGVTCGEVGACTTCGATYTASHEWTFTKPEDQNVITATCENANCGLAEKSYTITIEAPTGELVYDGTEKKVNIVVKEGEETLENAPFEINDITYTLEETPVDKCINAGTYTATVEFGEETISTSFEISEKNLIITAESKTMYINQAVSELTYTQEGLLQGDKIDLTLKIDTESNELTAGVYSIIHEGAIVIQNANKEDVTSNYSVSFNEGTLTVAECTNHTSDSACGVEGSCITCGETYTANHEWIFTKPGSENIINATCDNANCKYNSEQITITLVAPTGELVYDKNSKVAIVTDNSEENIFENTKITYELKGLNEDGEVIYTALEGETLPTNAGTYRASITLGEETVSVEFTIGKATATFTAPTANTELTEYSGQPQPLVTAGTTTGGTMQYKLGETGDWSTEIPTGTNATTYTVQYQFVVDDNYAYTGEETQGSVTVTIEPKEITATLTQDSGVYNGNTHQPTVKISGLCGTETLTNGTDFTVEYSDNINVGTATVTVKLCDTSTAKNYTFANNAKTTTLNYTITAGVASIKTAPTVKTGLVYTGSAQELVTAGEATNGTMQYRLSENESWSTTIPSGINAKTYTVYYKVKGDLNYSDSDVASVDVAIAKATPTTENFKLDLPTNLIFNGDPKTVTVTCGADIGDVTVEYYSGETKLENAPVTPGTYTVKINVAANDNYNAASGITSDDWEFAITECTKHEWENSTCTICKIDCEHKYEDGKSAISNKVTTQATCVEEGVLLSQCKICDYEEETPLDIVADAHKMSDWTETVKATCSSTGVEERTCENGDCKHTETRETEKNPNNHTYGDWVVTAATCVEDGEKVKICTNTECKHELKETIAKDPTAHKMATEWEVTKAPTCVETGLQVKVCLNNGCKHEIEEVIPVKADAHNLGGWVVTKAAKCTVAGEITRFCKNGNCEYKVTDSLDPDGKTHDFAKDFTVIEATCISTGSKFRACENEGCKEVTEKTEIAIDPDAHKNVETINVKQPTCEEKGYTGDEHCNDCKKTFDPGIEVDALGHTESDWIVDKEATFTEEGAKHTACTVCKKELKKEVIAKRALEVPKVKIENASNGIKVSWSQDEDATGYTVYSSTYNATTKKWSAWKNRGTAAATKSSWTDKTVSEGVTYRYTVRSVNGTNKSNYKATSGLCYVVAPKVTVSITSTGLLAKWNKVNNATSYIVYRRALVNGVWSSWVNLGSTKAEKNTWSDTSVQSGVTYRYTVRAVVGKVKSGYTSSSSIICLAQPVLKISNSAKGITGKWAQVAGATGYTIYRSEYNPSTKKWSKWLTLGTTGATAKTFTDKTVKSGYEYKYTIRAVSGKFKSTYQDSNKLVYLAQPTLKISNVANGIQGKWNQVDGAKGYIIYRSELKDGKWTGWTNLGTSKSTAKTFTDKTVKSGVTYKYTIRAKNGSYKSSYVASNQSVFLSVPTVKISNGITGVNVSWSKIEGATSYLVYRRELVDGKWTKWAEFKTVSETSLVDETVKSGTNYRYTVRALNGKSRSMYTSTGTLYYLTAPTVTVEKVDGVIKVNWTQTVGAKGYTIYRAELGADGKWSKWVTLGTATEKYSSCKDKTAKTGVTYKYTVRAVNGKVKSAYVDGAQITNQ